MKLVKQDRRRKRRDLKILRTHLTIRNVKDKQRQTLFNLHNIKRKKRVR